ncbi:MAG TPA: succinate dehydrogenase assembly factor 2 [Rhodobacterales bacterium]|nr:succinate dehydrogenase assembly factor 2 [Rhodobacterales bacterium]
MSELAEIRLKRLSMRSHRRGIKEMDIILGHFADGVLHALSGEELDRYEALLEENDHDLYQWVSGQRPPPEAFAALIAKIAAHAPSATKP